jgi:dUTP pyrophosphatase
MQKIKIKRIDKTLPLPIYETSGAVGFDLVARETTLIDPSKIELVPANVVVQVPKGYMLALFSRSSTPQKKGLLKPHSVGVIDQDYCGDNDELKIQVYNFTSQTVTVERGEKIAQGVFMRVDQFEWEEVDKMSSPDRGGFGTTS